jgi:hypothetical protein
VQPVPPRPHGDLTEHALQEVGADRVGIRLSPYGTFLDAYDKDPHSLYMYLCSQIKERGIAYIHMIESRVNGSVDVDDEDYDKVQRETLVDFREASRPLTFIAAGGYTRNNSAKAVSSGHTDMVRNHALSLCTYASSSGGCRRRLQQHQRRLQEEVVVAPVSLHTAAIHTACKSAQEICAGAHMHGN